MPSLPSYCNKVTEWIVLFAMIGLIALFNNKSPHKQCVPGFDPSKCGSSDLLSPDPALGYPVVPSTVPFKPMVIVSPFLWLLVVLSSMAITHCVSSVKLSDSWYIIFFKIEILVRSATLSIVIAELTTDAIKVSVGRPRPNFLENDELDDRIKSFPSGHTSFIFSAAFLLSLYFMRSLLSARAIFHRPIQSVVTDSMAIRRDGDDLNANSRRKVDELLTPLNGNCYFCLPLFLKMKHFQVLALLVVITPTVLAIFVGCSRLTDYKHHYADVLGGALIGSASSALSFAYYHSEFYCAM